MRTEYKTLYRFDFDSEYEYQQALNEYLSKGYDLSATDGYGFRKEYILSQKKCCCQNFEDKSEQIPDSELQEEDKE